MIYMNICNSSDGNTDSKALHNTVTQTNEIPIETEYKTIGNEDSNSTIQTDYKKKKSKKILIAISLCLLFSVLCSTLFFKNSQEQEYSKNLDNVYEKLNESTLNALQCAEITLNVWHNAIWNTSDLQTDKYTRQNNGTGSFYEDFNDALENLENDSEHQKKVLKISSEIKEVTSLMKKMKNPPAKFRACYNELEKIYNVYMECAYIAISPHGSYNDYSNEVSRLNKEFFDSCLALNQQLP